MRRNCKILKHSDPRSRFDRDQVFRQSFASNKDSYLVMNFMIMHFFPEFVAAVDMLRKNKVIRKSIHNFGKNVFPVKKFRF